MRFFLVSNTHGMLGAMIDVLAAQVRADAVIHAEDFSFFDDGSFERLDQDAPEGCSKSRSGCPDATGLLNQAT